MGQRATISARRCIESEVPADQGLRLREFLLGFAGEEERIDAIAQRGQVASGARRAFRHGRADELPDVARAVQRMHADAVGNLACELTVVGVERGRVDRYRIHAVDRSWIEERDAQCGLTVLAAKVRRLAGAEVAQDRLHAQHVLAQARAGRRRPGRRIPPFAVRLDLGAEAEDEAAAGKRRRSQANCAVTMGLRGNEMATPVPIRARRVSSARIICGSNGSCAASGTRMLS